MASSSKAPRREDYNGGSTQDAIIAYSGFRAMSFGQCWLNCTRRLDKIRCLVSKRTVAELNADVHAPIQRVLFFCQAFDSEDEDGGYSKWCSMEARFPQYSYYSDNVYIYMIIYL